jgi:hypothetical protein
MPPMAKQAWTTLHLAFSIEGDRASELDKKTGFLNLGGFWMNVALPGT